MTASTRASQGPQPLWVQVEREWVSPLRKPEGYRARDMTRLGLGAVVVATVGVGALWASTLLGWAMSATWAIAALVVAGIVTGLVSERRRLGREGRPFLHQDPDSPTR